MFASRVSARTLGEMAAVFALSVGIAGLAVPGAAQAAGTSGSTFNCYTQWYNTAWSQKCSSPGAAFAGTFQSKMVCNNQGDKYLTVGRAQYSTTTKPGSDCAFSAVSGSIIYY